MKAQLLSLLFIASFALPFATVETASAQDRERLSARAGEAYQRIARNIERRQARRESRPIERVRMNNTVYKYEGQAHRRHEEISSPEIIFHVDEYGRVVPGHVYDH